MEIVAGVFIGILQNIFQSWASIFSQSPMVVFWVNCTFPLTFYKKFRKNYLVHYSTQANHLKTIGMKLNFLTRSRMIKSYPERRHFKFWVKLCSTTIILSHHLKNLSSSFYTFQLCQYLAQTLLAPIFNELKI